MHRDGSRDFVADVIDETPLPIAKAAMAGGGNARFVSSTNQEPMLSQSGSKGEYSVLWLELKLLADVGLLAKPNAGKVNAHLPMLGGQAEGGRLSFYDD